MVNTNVLGAASRIRQLQAFVPTGVQITASLVRVFAFAWAVLQIDHSQQSDNILYFVGFLPFYGLLDIFVQSWSRSAQINSAPWVSTIGVVRIAYGILSVLTLTLVAFLTANLNLLFHGVILVSATCVIGSLSLLWERWLAAPHRAMAAAVIEIVLLLAAIMAYKFGYAGEIILLFCFVSYMLARLLALMIPGRAAGVDSLPSDQVRLHHYLGYAIGQQILGASAASMPSIYATMMGTTTGLGVALALFRIMHSFAAMASFVVNAIGSRLFFGEAVREMTVLETIANIFRRYRIWIDGTCLLVVVVTTSLFGPIKWLIIFACVGVLATLNFRSSLEMNKGRPEISFLMQFGVVLISIMAMVTLNNALYQAVIILGFYVAFSVFTEKLIDRISAHITN